jgi:hypothetical protein
VSMKARAGRCCAADRRPTPCPWSAAVVDVSQCGELLPCEDELAQAMAARADGSVATP